MVAALAVLAREVSAQAPAPVKDREAASLQIRPENVRLNNYLHDLAGRSAVISMVGSGVVAHFRNPGLRENAAEGLAGRIAARAGQAAVQVSVRHGLAALMHRSTDYQPCECHGFGPRVEHALLETFTDRRPDGSRAFSVPRIAGAYAGGFSQLAWEPHRNAGDVALGTTLSFGLTAVFNIARELSGLAR